MNWKIAGRAGEGISVTGMIFAKTCMRHGLHCFTYGEYPSLIRGGHNTMQVSASSGPVSCQLRAVDIMIALNDESISQHLEEFTDATVHIVDKKATKVDWEKHAPKGRILDLPMHAISLETTGSTIAENMVALGASCAVLCLDLSVLETIIQEAFVKKGKEVIAKNILAAQRGYAYAKEQSFACLSTIPISALPQILVSGNEVIGLAALSAGVQFYAAYPMTPASSLLEYLAKAQDAFPIVVKHAEDEISAINQAIGASFAGVRSMVGTSGGGFALMVEGVSLAGIAETPLVVMEGQRPGPATGLPTWTCQADLQFVLHAGHGEFPKVVVAPGDIVEAFNLTRLAFEIAEKYHTQVYILGDKFLLESSQSVPRFADTWTNERFGFAPDVLLEDNSFKRFALSDSAQNGVSPRSIPGQAHGLQLTNSYEHDEYGYATEESVMTIAMVDKRLKKLDAIRPLLPKPILLGPAQAEITFVEWGSTKLVMEEVIRQANTVQPQLVNAIHIQTAMPFHIDEFTALASQAKKLVMIEGNATRQCEQLIREKTGIVMHDRINRYDGRPFFVEDIIAWIDQHKGVT